MTGETVPEGGDDSRDKEDGSRVLGRFDPGLEEKDEGLSSQFRRRTMNTLPVKEDMCRGQSRPEGMEKVFTLPPHGLAMALKDMWFQTCRTKDEGRENFLRDSPMQSEHPDSPTEAVSALLCHNRSWDMNHLQLTTQECFAVADGLDQTVQSW